MEMDRGIEAFLRVPLCTLWSTVLASSLNGYGERSLRPRDRPVQRVALNRFAARFRDQTDQIMPSQSLGCRRARVVVDLFFHHRAVNIIGPEAQRNLRNL